MEDELDINVRAYFVVLRRYWLWIAGVTVIGMLMAFGFMSIQPEVYEATALVVVTRPVYTLQFDSRVKTSDNLDLPASKVFVELAVSGQVVQALYDQLNPKPAKVASPDDLRTLLSAEIGADPTLSRLKVRASSPADAVSIANLWADAFAARANDLYEGHKSDQVQFFETQATNTKKELEAREKALEDFQSHNLSALLTNQLNSQLAKQNEYLQTQRNIANLVRNMHGLHDQLSKQPPNRSSTAGEQLSALFLQMKAYNAQDVPLQVQIGNPDTLSKLNVGDQMAYLDNLVRILEAQSVELDKKIDELKPQIFGLQQQIQANTNELAQLERSRLVASETYSAVVHKLEESQIAVKDVNNTVQVASHAAIPSKPTGSRTLSILSGGLVGLVLGIMGAFVWDWWRSH